MAGVLDAQAEVTIVASDRSPAFIAAFAKQAVFARLHVVRGIDVMKRTFSPERGVFDIPAGFASAGDAVSKREHVTGMSRRRARRRADALAQRGVQVAR